MTKAVADIPWLEAVARAARQLDGTLTAAKLARSLDVLRPYLHGGQIPAHHGGLYTFPGGQRHSGPGKVRPEWWAHAYVDCGRVVFFFEPVWSGSALIEERVFAYAVSIVFDGVAFNAVVPAAAPSSMPEPASPSPQVEPEPPPVKPTRRGPPERYDWDEGFQFMRRELDNRGDPLAPENAVEGWRSDADVARLVAAHIATGEPTARSQTHRANYSSELQKWRAEQAERNGA